MTSLASSQQRELLTPQTWPLHPCHMEVEVVVVVVEGGQGLPKELLLKGWP